MSLNFASFFDASTIIKLHIIAAFFCTFYWCEADGNAQRNTPPPPSG